MILSKLIRTEPAINVRALLDRSAQVTKVCVCAPGAGLAGGGTDVSPTATRRRQRAECDD
jgi:hypothetical protein